HSLDFKRTPHGLFHFHCQEFRYSKCKNHRPGDGIERCALENLVHEGCICEQQLQNDEYSTDPKRNMISKQRFQFQCRCGEVTYIEQIYQFADDQHVDCGCTCRFDTVAACQL